MAAFFAPKPALYLSVTRDWTAQFPKEEFPPIRAVYEKLGAADRVANRHFDFDHDYNRTMREAMYAWFNRWLKGVEDEARAAEPELRTETPQALAALDRPPEGNRGAAGVVEWFRANRSFTGALAREALLDLLGETGVADAPLAATAVEAGDWRGWRMEKVAFASEKEFTIPALLLHPRAERGPAVVVLSESKSAVLARRAGLVEGLLEAGMRVLLPDARLKGELRIRWDLNCVLWGRPEAGMAAHDASRAVELLASRKDVDGDRIAVLGLGAMGPSALFAAVLDGRIRAVAADAFGTTFAKGREQPVVPLILRHGDLPQVAGLSKARKWLHGAEPREAFGEAAPGKAEDVDRAVVTWMSAWQ
jgi:hypothetical protein